LHANTFDHLFTSPFTILAKGIQKSHLIELSLRHNQLHPSAGKEIGMIISKCSTLERLDLRNNELKTGIHEIFDVLGDTKNLKELLLWDNLINAKGFQYVANGLKKNTSLRWLDLSENPIFAVPNKTLVTFKEALMSHSNLLVLSMAATGMNPHGAEMLSEVMGKNLKLRRIDIGYNPIGTAGLWALEAAAKKSKTILSMEIQTNDGDQVQKELFEDIKNYCTLNRKLMFERGEEIPQEVLHSEQTILGRESLVSKPMPIDEAGSPPGEPEIEVEIDFDASTKALQRENQKKAIDSLVDDLKHQLPKAKERALLIIQLLKNWIGEENSGTDVCGDLAASLKALNKKFCLSIPKIPENQFLADVIDVNETICSSLEKYNENLKKIGKTKFVEVLHSPREKPVLSPKEEPPTPPLAKSPSLTLETPKRFHIDPEDWAPRTRNTAASIAADFGLVLPGSTDSLLLPSDTSADPAGMTSNNSNNDLNSLNQEKLVVVVRNAFAPSPKSHLDDQSRSQIEKRVKTECNGFELFDIKIEEKEGIIYIKVKTEDLALNVLNHLQNRDIEGRKLTSEVISEIEFFKLFPVKTVMN